MQRLHCDNGCGANVPADPYLARPLWLTVTPTTEPPLGAERGPWHFCSPACCAAYWTKHTAWPNVPALRSPVETKPAFMPSASDVRPSPTGRKR
jgi:hypothetical protein